MTKQDICNLVLECFENILESIIQIKTLSNLL